MIRYALRCKQGHDFEGWFRSSEGFDGLRAAGQVACSICGETDVEKALMAPSLPARQEKEADAEQPAPITAPQNDHEKALQDLRQQIEANSDYVGLSFADQARAMHEGSVESRPIHGESKLEDAKKLLEDGVPVMPLPFIPRQKTN